MCTDSPHHIYGEAFSHPLFPLGLMTALCYQEAGRIARSSSVGEAAEGGRSDGEGCLWGPPCAAHFTCPWIHSIILMFPMGTLKLGSTAVKWEAGLNSDLPTPKSMLSSTLLVGVSMDTVILEANLATSNKIKYTHTFLTLKLRIQEFTQYFHWNKFLKNYAQRCSFQLSSSKWMDTTSSSITAGMFKL